MPLETSARRLDSLLAALDRAEIDHAADIADVDPAHRRGALNLVHFTTMRRLDL